MSVSLGPSGGAWGGARVRTADTLLTPPGPMRICSCDWMPCRGSYEDVEYVRLVPVALEPPELMSMGGSGSEAGGRSVRLTEV